MTEFISRKYGNDGYEVIIKTDNNEHYKASEDFARRLIDHAKPVPDINVGNKWIPVTERLPDKHRTYLCYYGFNQFRDYMMIGCLDWIMFDKHPHWQHESGGVFVTHWMPLPEPPMED